MFLASWLLLVTAPFFEMDRSRCYGWCPSYTDANGVTTPCSSTTVSLGPYMSRSCGTSSNCAILGVANGASNKCPSGQDQLCKVSADCGPGYTCSASASGYWVTTEVEKA